MKPTESPGGTRRSFLAGSIGAGFAAAVAPVGELLAQVVRTDTAGLQAGAVTIAVDGGAMPAYLARPQAGDALPVVLVVHEAWGVHEYIADVCRRFAKAGYLAIAPELFYRQGDPRKLASTEQVFQEVISRVSDAQVLGDLQATMRFAPGRGGDAARMGITGFCWGGRIVWMQAARAGPLRAGVAWYGRLTTSVNAMTPEHPLDVAERLGFPVLGLYGGRDAAIPVSSVEEMRTRLSFGSAASQASEIVVYPDAPHAFHADHQASYRPADAQDGWRRCLAWLRTHGVA